MRINLTKKDLVNLVYMRIGFSKQIAENLIEDFLFTIATNIKNIIDTTEHQGLVLLLANQFQ